MLYPSSIVLNPDDNRLAFSYYCQVITGVGRVQGVIKCGVAPSGLFATVSAEELEGEVFVLEGTRPVYGNIRDEGVLSQLDPQRRSQIVRGRLFLRHDLEALNVSLMMSMDYSSLISKALVNGLPFLLAGIGSCALLYIMVRSFANAVQHRLNEVVEVAEQAKMGHLHVFLPNAKDDELGQLVDSFNALLSQLEQKAQAQIEHEKSEKRALQLALQYQMNPHFLFNTLNWLQMSMEMEEDREKLSNAIVQLGRLLRYNLNSDLLAPLQEEIENTRVYVHLMNLRKHDLIDLSVQMQAFDSRLRVIRFLLQPLCENAIQHGLIPGTPLHITIRGSLQEDLLCLHVINDGTKIEPERLSALQASMAEGRSGNGIGLANIATRLRLYYGDHASIQIASEDRETRVTLTIQMKQEEMADAAADCR